MLFTFSSSGIICPSSGTVNFNSVAPSFSTTGSYSIFSHWLLLACAPDAHCWIAHCVYIKGEMAGPRCCCTCSGARNIILSSLVLVRYYLLRILRLYVPLSLQATVWVTSWNYFFSCMGILQVSYFGLFWLALGLTCCKIIEVCISSDADCMATCTLMRLPYGWCL